MPDLPKGRGAFWGDPVLKAKLLELARGASSSDWAKGFGGELFRLRQNRETCPSYACTDYERDVGLPAVLAWLGYSLASWLPEPAARVYPQQFLAAVPVGGKLFEEEVAAGAVLTMAELAARPVESATNRLFRMEYDAWRCFAAWLLDSPLYGLVRFAPPECHRVVQEFAQFCRSEQAFGDRWRTEKRIGENAARWYMEAQKVAEAIGERTPGKYVAHAVNHMAAVEGAEHYVLTHGEPLPAHWRSYVRCLQLEHTGKMVHAAAWAVGYQTVPDQEVAQAICPTATYWSEEFLELLMAAPVSD